MHDTLKNHKVEVVRGYGFPLIARKLRPNDPCPCGSGKKVKYCHGRQTVYYKTNKQAKE